MQIDKLLNNTLYRSSLRRTPERSSIMGIVISYKGHFSAIDIFNQIPLREDMAIATVYNILNLFEKHGYIERVPSIDRRLHYKRSDLLEYELQNVNESTQEVRS